MITEEEIEKLLDCSKCKLKECIACDITYTDRKNIREYIEQLKKNNYSLTIIAKAEIEQRERLETEKQDVTEALEKINNSLEKDGFTGYADDIQDILSYMKGEEHAKV